MMPAQENNDIVLACSLTKMFKFVDRLIARVRLNLKLFKHSKENNMYIQKAAKVTVLR